MKPKHKLHRILPSKSISKLKISVPDLVEVFVSCDKEKRGKCLTLRTILSTHRFLGTITVPGTSGRTIRASFKDIRMDLVEDSFASIVEESIDTLNNDLNNALSA